MPSSSPVVVHEDSDDDDVDDIDDVGEGASLIVHCSSSAIILTSLEMSRTCAELHCMRELRWRCILSTEAAMREYVGRACCIWGDDVQQSLGGVGGPGPYSSSSALGSMRRLCWLSWTARSPIVHGGVSGRRGHCDCDCDCDCSGSTALDVGETFMAARSAS